MARLHQCRDLDSMGRAPVRRSRSRSLRHIIFPQPTRASRCRSAECRPTRIYADWPPLIFHFWKFRVESPMFRRDMVCVHECIFFACTRPHTETEGRQNKAAGTNRDRRNQSRTDLGYRFVPAASLIHDRGIRSRCQLLLGGFLLGQQ